MQYHYHLQGFIYNLLRGSIYDQLHDTRGCKFFSYSNIFPFDDLRQNDLRTLIISSPDEQFIRYLYDIMQLSAGRGTEIKIGAMKFNVDSLRKLYTRLPDNSNLNLITGTPIIVRVPREKYKEYNFEPLVNSDSIYWRNGHPIDLLLEQLQNTLLHKYAEYHWTETCKDIHLFHGFEFKKQISTRVFIKDFEQVIIGTVWEFGFNNGNKELVQFALDSGLGERNSLGFGFMNLSRKDIYKENT